MCSYDFLSLTFYCISVHTVSSCNDQCKLDIFHGTECCNRDQVSLNKNLLTLTPLSLPLSFSVSPDSPCACALSHTMSNCLLPPIVINAQHTARTDEHEKPAEKPHTQIVVTLDILLSIMVRQNAVLYVYLMISIFSSSAT